MRVLSHQEIDRLCAAADGRGRLAKRNHAVLRLLALTGVGVGEALALRAVDFDSADAALRIPGRRARTVPLPSAVVDALDAWVDQRERLGLEPTGPLLCSAEGHALESSYIRRLIARVGARAGTQERLNARALRESFAARELARGVSADDLRVALGHGTSSGTLRFLRAVSDDERDGGAADERRASLDLLLESAHCGLVVVRAVRGSSREIEDFTVEFANPAALGMMRVSADRLIEQPITDVFPAAADDGTYARWRELIEAGGRDGDSEHFYREEPGARHHWYSLRRLACGDRVALSFVDQSPLRALAAQRRLGESRHAGLMEASRDGAMVIDAQGVIVEANTAAEEILGLVDGQLVGRTLRDARWRAVRDDGTVPTDDEGPVPVTMATGRPVRDEVIGVRRPNGEVAWLSISTEAIEGRGGPPFEVAVAFSDVSAQRRARAERRATQHALGLVLRSSGALLIRCAPDGMILDAAGASESLVGVAIDRLIGRHCEDAVHPEDRAAVREAYRQVLDGTGPVDMRHRIIRASGATAWIDRRLEVCDSGGPTAAVEVQSLLSALDAAATDGRPAREPALL